MGSPAAVRPALRQTFEAGKDLIDARLDLARVDVMLQMERTTRRLAMVAAAGLFAFIGWHVLLAAAVLYFEPLWPLSIRLAMAAGIEIVLAAACLALGRVRGGSDEHD